VRAGTSGILGEAGLPPQRLRLELTESVVMTNPAKSCELLGALSASGVGLALDDFGTGYSSLGYLQQFPFTCLKLDRCSVQDRPGSNRSETITRAVIALGQTLRMRVIAEGVENQQQLESLQSLGCDEAQGYLLSRPLSFSELVEWMLNRRNGVFCESNKLGARRDQ